LKEIFRRHVHVSCYCDPTSVRITCTSKPDSNSTEGRCRHTYEECRSSSECCSAPMQRCVRGQCRASASVAKYRIGDAYGGAVEKSRSVMKNRIRGSTKVNGEK
jgi:hypothetical protein